MSARGNSLIKFAIFYFLLLGVLTTSVYAADESVPASEQAGVLAEKFREQPQYKRLEEIALPEIENKYVEEEGAGLPDTEFPITSIRVDGGTVFPQDVIDEFKRPYENQSTNLQKLKELALDITAHYRTRGYVTTRAIVPPQKLEDGQVRIQIHEAKVGLIKIEGLKYTRESLVRRRFNVREGDILRYQNLERYLTALNANPDRIVRVVLEPGEKPETTDIILKVEEKFPFHAGYGFNNLGTVSTGRFRQSATATATNLLGFDDQLSSRVEISERRDFIGVSSSYQVPLNARGDILTFDFSRVEVELGKDLKPLAAAGRAVVFGPTLIMPFLHSKYVQGEFTTGFDYKRIRTLVQGIPVAKDDLRVFRFGPNFIENDRWGRSIFSNNVQVAFGGFMGGLDNNDPNASRREADGYFWQYNASIGRLQNIWNGIQAVGRTSFQLTPHRLIPAQQFRIGGYDTVRGYPEGEYLGDYGFQGSLEVRVPPYFIPKDLKCPITKMAIRDIVRGVAFVDFGKAFVIDPFENEDSSQRMTSVGGGIRVNIARNLQGRIDWGIPVGGKSSEGSASRIHFGLQVNY